MPIVQYAGYTSDHPEMSIASIRRQLEMVFEFDEDLVDAIVACSTPPEIRAVDDLDEVDADLVVNVNVNGNGDLERLFEMDDRDAEILLEMSDEIQSLAEAIDYLDAHQTDFMHQLGGARNFGGGTVDCELVNPLYNETELCRVFDRGKGKTQKMEEKDEKWKKTTCTSVRPLSPGGSRRNERRDARHLPARRPQVHRREPRGGPRGPR